MKRIEAYSVGDLAKAAGVTVRTLHHYDAIGLLKPAGTALNGYRVYGTEGALRLQEILFYRQIGLPLSEIRSLLEGDDRLSRLVAHRVRVAAEASEAAARLKTLDATIAHLKGECVMELEDFYRPFPPETQAAYEAWLIETYGPEMANDISHARSGDLQSTEGASAAQMEELRSIESDLAAAMQDGQGAGALAPLFDRHRAWVAKMWCKPCSPQAYAGLADLYHSHADFVARYETLAPGFSAWLVRNMKAYADGLEA